MVLRSIVLRVICTNEENVTLRVQCIRSAPEVRYPIETSTCTQANIIAAVLGLLSFIATVRIIALSLCIFIFSVVYNYRISVY